MYCKDNPIMFVDPSGYFPKWVSWLISGVAIIGGILLCATGIASFAGGLLLGVGAGSIFNGYINESNGGDFTSGYVGGAISGLLCALGAGLGGMAFAAAYGTANLACIGYLTLGISISFVGGFAGNLAGTVVTNWIDSGYKNINLNWEETMIMSACAGMLNIFAGMGSSLSSIVGNMGKVTTDLSSKIALRILAGMFAGGTEALYDLFSSFIGKLISLF